QGWKQRKASYPRHDEPARGPQAHVPHGTNIRDRKRAKTDRGREYRSDARQKFVRERTRVVLEESRRIVRLDIPWMNIHERGGGSDHHGQRDEGRDYHIGPDGKVSQPARNR